MGHRSFAFVGGGGTIAMCPREVPGGDQSLIVVDPEGAEFVLAGKA